MSKSHDGKRSLVRRSIAMGGPKSGVRGHPGPDFSLLIGLTGQRAAQYGYQEHTVRRPYRNGTISSLLRINTRVFNLLFDNEQDMWILWCVVSDRIEKVFPTWYSPFHRQATDGSYQGTGSGVLLILFGTPPVNRGDNLVVIGKVTDSDG